MEEEKKAGSSIKESALNPTAVAASIELSEIESVTLVLWNTHPFINNMGISDKYQSKAKSLLFNIKVAAPPFNNLESSQ